MAFTDKELASLTPKEQAHYQKGCSSCNLRKFRGQDNGVQLAAEEHIRKLRTDAARKSKERKETPDVNKAILKGRKAALTGGFSIARGEPVDVTPAIQETADVSSLPKEEIQPTKPVKKAKVEEPTLPKNNEPTDWWKNLGSSSEPKASLEGDLLLNHHIPQIETDIYNEGETAKTTKAAQYLEKAYWHLDQHMREHGAGNYEEAFGHLNSAVKNIVKAAGHVPVGKGNSRFRFDPSLEKSPSVSFAEAGGVVLASYLKSQGLPASLSKSAKSPTEQQLIESLPPSSRVEHLRPKGIVEKALTDAQQQGFNLISDDARVKKFIAIPLRKAKKEMQSKEEAGLAPIEPDIAPRSWETTNDYNKSHLELANQRRSDEDKADILAERVAKRAVNVEKTIFASNFYDKLLKKVRVNDQGEEVGPNEEGEDKLVEHSADDYDKMRNEADSKGIKPIVWKDNKVWVNHPDNPSNWKQLHSIHMGIVNNALKTGEQIPLLTQHVLGTAHLNSIMEEHAERVGVSKAKQRFSDSPEVLKYISDYEKARELTKRMYNG